MGSGKSGRVKPSEVAADTKHNFIPLLNAQFADKFPPYSVLYRQPCLQLAIKRRKLGTRPPWFRVEQGDPVMRAIDLASRDSQASQSRGGPKIRVPFICAAHEQRPGGDWETGSTSYEEKLCRRSNLSATLASPLPQSRVETNYPIPLTGGILSDKVVVCRGPHDRYEKLETWHDLPVLSVTPIRWPKLKDNGCTYSFEEERKQMQDKMRGALRVCLYNDYDRVVVGDFGLGNANRNPPRELAKMWRDVLLFDPDLRGQFVYVVFVFEDAAQNTVRCILEEMMKREAKERMGGGGVHSKARVEELSALSGRAPSDMAIFEHMLDAREIERVVSEPDPRYGLEMITS